jgi:hypothetical protein
MAHIDCEVEDIRSFVVHVIFWCSDAMRITGLQAYL